MKNIQEIRYSFTGKLILFFIVLLSLSSLIVGFTGYSVARRELNRRGEQILRNSVTQAVDLIKTEHSKVRSGITTEERAQERIKEILLGPMDDELGIRELHHRIDLGENGYFIIYDSFGYEIMHPSMEGDNVLDVTDLADDRRYLVREQIDIGINGGGFLYYSWWLPHSDKISPKISYSEYYRPWDWIVVATAYEIDFNKAANLILLVLLPTMLALIALVSAIIIVYVRNMATPILEIAKGMEKVADDVLEPVGKPPRRDETALLVEGYNHMIESLRTARKDIEDKNQYISFLAFHDDLTGLPNRHGLEAHVRRRIDMGCGPAQMVQANIQGLKIINSTLGYKEGDRLLKAIGSYLSQRKNPDLFFSRTSSNEFTLWMENTPGEDALRMIADLREATRDYIHSKNFFQTVNMHLAMATYPADGGDFGTLYEKTSMTMKTAKDSNSLKLFRYHEGIRESIENELLMKQYLRKALKEHEITAHYQTQVDYRTEKVVGVEALARWNSKEMGAVPPSIFIPAIDSQNLINEFGQYMIKTVLGDYQALRAKYDEGITVSINISPSYLMDTNNLGNLRTELETHGVPPEKLTLEITEDVFISDFDAVSEIIDRLHEMGVRISIDDFGTGYSSLSYLTRISFDEMKIDKSFINKILEEPKAFQLFEVLCDIAKIYGYDIVAEGVETDRQLDMIKGTSLEIIQGFLFSRPEPLDTVES